MVEWRALLVGLAWVAAKIVVAEYACRNQPFVLSPERLIVPGTHYIGVLVGVASLDLRTGLCRDTIDQQGIDSVEVVELVSHLIDQINYNGSILPAGVRLGLVVLDDYNMEQFTSSQAAKFLPINDQPFASIAVLCCVTTARTHQVTPLTSRYGIPQIGFSSVIDVTQDDLGPPSYFLNTAPSGNTKIRLLVDMLRLFGWSYVSVLYSDDTFGIEAFRIFEQYSQTANICIAHASHIRDKLLPQIFRAVESKSATIVVLLIMSKASLKPLVTTFASTDRQYTWVRPTTWARDSVTPEEMKFFLGGFSFTNKLPSPAEKLSFLRDSGQWHARMRRNPWLHSYLARCRCKWRPDEFGCDDVSRDMAAQQCGTNKDVIIAHDALSTIVYGLSNYSHAGYPLDPFDTNVFFDILENVAFPGESGDIKFKDGETPGDYLVLQEQLVDGRSEPVTVGVWIGESSRLTLNATAVVWSSSGIPESICSLPCDSNELQIVRESACCWQCVPCLPHQRPVNGVCASCPSLWWPDGQSCLLLPAVSVSPTSGVGIATIVCAFVGVSVTGMAAVMFIRHRNARLIKATCRETSAFVLLGVALQFFVPTLLLIEPSDLMCATRRAAFQLTFSLIYGAMLVKCIKIYRIFWMGRRSTQTPRFVGVTAQMAIISTVQLVQILVIGISIIVYPPKSEDWMPAPHVPEVERVCYESVSSLVLSFSFNVLLLASCAAFALKTRKLPHNFNESLQIAFCVTIVLFSICIFMSALLLSSKSAYRVTLLFLTQFTSAVMVLFTLFLPKLYAICFIHDDEAAHTTLNHARKVSNQVVPKEAL